MTSVIFQDILGQVQGEKVSGSLGCHKRTLQNCSLPLDYEKRILPIYRSFGDQLRSFGNQFSRHHPQGRRVRHIPGLLDVPICAVFDYAPPIGTNPNELTLKVEKVGMADGKTSVPLDPAKQRGSSSNLRRLKAALYDGSGIRTKISRIKQQSGFKPNLPDISRNLIGAPWRENLRAFVAALDLLLSLQSDEDSGKEPSRTRTLYRPRTSDAIQALGTVGKAPTRPKTNGSRAEKLPPLTGLDPRFSQGYPRPGTLQRYSKPGISSVRTLGLDGARTGQVRTPSSQCHVGPKNEHDSKRTGRLITSPSRTTSSSSSSSSSSRASWWWKWNEIRLNSRTPPEVTEEAEAEGLVLRILCQLLEVNDLNVILSWLIKAPDAEKAIVLDLVRSVLSGRSANDGRRRDNLDSGLIEHSGSFEGQSRGRPATDAPRGVMATGDCWSSRREGGNGLRQTGRVDRLVIDHSRPDIRSNLITCNGETKNGDERPQKWTNEGQNLHEDVVKQ